jgi:hypothetical protein
MAESFDFAPFLCMLTISKPSFKMLTDSSLQSHSTPTSFLTEQQMSPVYLKEQEQRWQQLFGVFVESFLQT